MKISVFGLGYVGAVSCACFAKIGHTVIGVDVNNSKIDLINSGKSPIVEKDLDEYIKEAVEQKKLTATLDLSFAIKQTELSLVCVGTPSQITGAIDLSFIYRICQEIGQEIKNKSTFHTIVIRSTIIPGTIKDCNKLIEEISGKKEGKDFCVVSNPEFLREGSAINDFWNPPYTIVGSASDKATEAMKQLYSEIKAPFYTLKPEESEMIKYANNNFHAVKVTFANEIGNICKELGVDGHVVMDIVSKDKKLNLSAYYMKPGFAFGGSCLPKDVRGLTYRSKQLDLNTPLLNSLNNSNEEQIQRGLNMILKTGRKKIGFLGFSFKADTDDLRESPIVILIETLIGKGFELYLYDKNVLLSKLTGKNRDYITGHIPHISALLKNNENEVIDAAEVIVFGNNSDEFKELLSVIPSNKAIVDLVRVDSKKTSGVNYEGICW